MLLRLSVLWMLVWSLIVVPLDLALARDVLWALASRSYPSTRGEVAQSEVVEQFQQAGMKTPLRFEYRYTVAGQEFSGERISYVRTSINLSRAKQFVESHPVGQSLDVFYDAHNPADCVLRRDIDGEPFFTALFLAPFNMVLVAGWTSVWRRFRKRCLWPLERRGSRWLLRRYPGNPLFVALILIGAFSFLATMIVGTGGWSESLPGMLGVWGAILLSAAYGYFHTRAMAASEPPCLIVDDASRVLIWPALGEQSELQVSADQVLTVEFDSDMEGVPQTNSTTDYTVTVTLRNSAGQTEQRSVLHTGKALPGQSVAEWLQDWVGSANR